MIFYSNLALSIAVSVIVSSNTSFYLRISEIRCLVNFISYKTRS